MLPSRCWFSEFPDALTTCLPGIPVLYFHVGHRLTSLLLSCHQPFQLGGHVFGKRPHDLSGSTQCLRYPLPSSACIPQPPLILSCSPAPQLSLCLSPWRPCPEWSVTVSLLKSFLLLSNKDGAKSHPKLTPHRVFPQYFTENTKQKCHSTRGVFFLRM